MPIKARSPHAVNKDDEAKSPSAGNGDKDFIAENKAKELAAAASNSAESEAVSQCTSGASTPRTHKTKQRLKRALKAHISPEVPGWLILHAISGISVVHLSIIYMPALVSVIKASATEGNCGTFDSEGSAFNVRALSDSSNTTRACLASGLSWQSAVPLSQTGSSLVLLLTTPVLGALADYTPHRKRFGIISLVSLLLAEAAGALLLYDSMYLLLLLLNACAFYCSSGP